MPMRDESMKLKLQYDSYLGSNVLPYMEAKEVPQKGQSLNVGGVMLEVSAVMETPFSKFHAAIVYVRESAAFLK
jgi:hypothetical protein